MGNKITKFANENNIRLLIPNKSENSKFKPKNDKNHYAKAKFIYEWKTESFIYQKVNTYIRKNDRKLNGE